MPRVGRSRPGITGWVAVAATARMKTAKLPVADETLASAHEASLSPPETSGHRPREDELRPAPVMALELQEHGESVGVAAGVPVNDVVAERCQPA